MPECPLERLRELRERARKLLKGAGPELLMFLHSDGSTFRRKPDSDSIPGDVNVTTTCSCLMALSFTNKLGDSYKSDKAIEAFNKLVEAPWMSSGLTENNAFTTTLVLRTLGFLTQTKVLEATEADRPDRKEWESDLGIMNVPELARQLKERTRPESDFVWRSLSDAARREVDKAIGADPSKTGGVRTLLTLELGRLIQSWIYEEKRFENASASTIDRLKKSDTTYGLAAANRVLLREHFAAAFSKSTKRSLSEIAVEMASDPSRFRINGYPSSAAVIYWFIDGIDRARIKLPAKAWETLCKWAADEFNHERSLVAAQHGAKMDPVAMVMSACLCSRLRMIIGDSATATGGGLGADRSNLALLPARPEMEHAIRQFWEYQSNGIWPKYFPLFHYQDAGSNFCFTFELLEAVLAEFGREDNELLDDQSFVNGLESALSWCEQNHLKWPDGTRRYTGWNSGGNLDTLRKDQPESWATAVMHMFLWELSQVLSARIQKRLTKEYHAYQPESENSGVDGLLDIEILEKGTKKSLKAILKDELISKYAGENQHTLSRRPVKAPRSALLFGPPGTSKTKVTEAVARDLGWPLILIDPSHFLRQGLDNIYLQADKIFKDLMDLSGVIVLFDEMDALVQTRDSALRLDTVSQFLTTFMLPKLTELHDQGRIIFLMATNFQERFDQAIKRAGRFDLLLCMGPPTLSEKLASLHVFIKEDGPTTESIEGAKEISARVSGVSEVEFQLELYTFGEFMSLVRTITGGAKDIATKVKSLDPGKFLQLLKEDSKYVGLRIRDLKPLTDYYGRTFNSLKELDGLEELTPGFIQSKKIEVTPVIRYVLDRRESKQQG